MSEDAYTVLYRFRYLFGGLLIIVALLLLSLFLSFISASQAAASSNTYSQSDESNIVTDGFDAALNSISNTLASSVSIEKTVNNKVADVSNSLAHTVANSGRAAASVSYTGGRIVAHSLTKGVSLVAGMPVYAWHGVANISHVASFITPAQDDKAPAPKIDPTIAAEIAAAIPAVSAATPTIMPADSSPQWPIHGAITEEFGVPHWPYQPTHTGIDISDGTAPGTTPVRPFKPGRVIAVVHSNLGFGNHVIIDHGGGMVSLYGHLNSTSVQVGQPVDKNTVLGFEGTTGVSTGVHLHFEIDINGQPVNPHRFVPGQP